MKTGTTPNYPTDKPQSPAKPTKLTPRSSQFADPTPHAKFEFWGLEFCYSSGPDTPSPEILPTLVHANVSLDS